MRTPKNVHVVKADYLDGYKLRITFNDGKTNDIDFTEIIQNLKGYYSKYQKSIYFKKFKIDDSNVVWGNDWDLIFPIDKLYKNTLSGPV